MSKNSTIDIGINISIEVLYNLMEQLGSEADRLHDQYEKTHDLHADRIAYAFELAEQAVEKAIANATKSR